MTEWLLLKISHKCCENPVCFDPGKPATSLRFGYEQEDYSPEV